MVRIHRKRHVQVQDQISMSTSKSTIKATSSHKEKSQVWKVIAPFVTLSRKIDKKAEDDQFSFYLKKRPAVLLRDLSSFMSDSVDLPSLIHETSEVLKRVTKSSWVTLYLVDPVANEIYPSQTVARERYKIRWKIGEPSLVAAYVAEIKEYVMVEDVLVDTRFPEGVGYEDRLAQAVMCIPIVTPDGECFAVLEFVRTLGNPSYEEADLKICVMVTAWMGVAIHQNQERLALERQQELNNYLLDLITCYMEEHVIMEKLMSEVVKFAKMTLGAERGSFFIIDKESEELIAHLFDETDESDDTGDFRSKKVRFSKERGIAGLVAKTGVTVNIRDAYQDNRFNREVDQKTGFITRSILCMPIMGKNGVIGVVQVVNKKNGGCFTRADETLFKTFSLYCSLAVHYTNVNTEGNKQKHLNAMNVRTLHTQQPPCLHYIKFYEDELTVKMPMTFTSFSWYISASEEMVMAPQYTLYMMCQLIDISEINISNMIKFILTVRKFYRDIPYHNFEHAFNVCHCMYVILKRNPHRFSKLEVKAFMVACICHDLDHVGFTNNFLSMTKHDLALLYETSILENHHSHMALMLVKDSNIFPTFTEEETKLFYTEIQEDILATDLAIFFERKPTLIKLLNTKVFSWENPEHVVYAKSIIMNSCDLSGLCKPFHAAKRIADNLYREFYRQGDAEKELGVCPLSVMDRDRNDCVPEDQIRFLNVVVIPCVDILRVLLSNTHYLLDGALKLREDWQEIIDTRGQKVWRQDFSVVEKYLD